MSIPDPVEFRRLKPVQAPRPDASAPCSYATAFATYSDALLAHLTEVKAAALSEACGLAKMQLIDRYADYLTDTPVNHTNAAGRKKHPCIVDVLNDTIRAIRLRERSMPPTKPVLVSKRSRKSPRQGDRPSLIDVLNALDVLAPETDA
jgi:hypothetical protein